MNSWEDSAVEYEKQELCSLAKGGAVMVVEITQKSWQTKMEGQRTRWLVGETMTGNGKMGRNKSSSQESFTWTCYTAYAGGCSSMPRISICAARAIERKPESNK